MTDADELDKETTARFAGRLALYRTLSAAIKRLSLETLHPEGDVHAVRALAIQ
jgi:hypothetical protein